MSSQSDYIAAGFSPFLTRSIDAIAAQTLTDMAKTSQTTSREVNYDQSIATGSLGSSIQIGNIVLDSVNGRLSILDETGNEVLRLGNLDD